MAEQRKRLSKKASKILFEIICEESFEGQQIKTLLPASRRISKAREGLWEYIRSELARRCEETYDLGTLSAAWYYNLRKIGSCFNQIDLAPGNTVALGMLSTLERYVCNNLGERIRGRGRKEDNADVDLTPHELLTHSRQSTMDASGNFSLEDVSNEMENGGDELEHAEMADNGGNDDDLDDCLDVNETPGMEISDHLGNCGVVEMGMEDPPLPSRYNTADTIPISRNNSSMSASGYDADNEKGIIKRRRKEWKKRAGQEREMNRVEEVEKKEEEENEENVNDELDIEVDDREKEEEEENGEEMNEKKKLVNNLKGMIDSLRDHIVSLRIMGLIDGFDMETLADSFENARDSIFNNEETA